MTLRELNHLAPNDAAAMLLQACGSQMWATQLAAERPFTAKADLLDAADRVWLSLSEADWLEAFAAHPRIGQHSDSALARTEQAAALAADESVRQELAHANDDYERRFGFIFIVFASGKTPEEMLALLRARIQNDRSSEIRNAAAEQMKITRKRLNGMIMVPSNA